MSGVSRDTSCRPNHALEFLKQYWFLISFSFAAVGVVANLYFEVTYIRNTVNPDAVVEYRVKEAVLNTKREMRWCLGKLMVDDQPIVRRKILECAD